MSKKFFLLFLLLLVPVVSAFDPITHFYVGEIAVQTAPDSTYKSLAIAHLNTYLMGSEANDISVIFYFSSFQNYQSTHNWDYCEKMLNTCAQTDDEKAFALGCLAHLAADSVSHNTYVPYYLNKYKTFDEASLHPMVEEALGKQISAEHPEIQGEIDDAFKNYYNYEGLITCANGGDSIGGLKIHDLLTVHRNALSDFYAKGYGAGAENAPFGTKIYVFWNLFQFVNKPFAKYVIKIDNRDITEKTSIFRIQQTLAASPDKQYDPSDSEALRNANKLSGIIQLFISGITALTFLWLGRKKRWTLLVSGASAIISALVMWYMGFLGILAIWMVLWVVSWPIVAYAVYRKYKQRKPLNTFLWFMIIINILGCLLLGWIWLI